MAIRGWLRKKIEDKKTQRHVGRAQKLEDLRRERLKHEGRLRVRDMELQEKARIKAAKKELRKKSWGYKLGQTTLDAAKTTAQQYNKMSGGPRKRPKKRRPPMRIM